MKFLPYDKFEIETTMSPEAFVAALNSQVEPKRLFRMSSNHLPFQGDISRDGFRITRIIHYRNSFLPIVSGKYFPGPSGIVVEIWMGLHPLVIVFMCVWFGGVGFGAFAMLSGLVTGQVQASPILLIPFGMLLFGWALVSGGFWFEAKKQKRMLIEMFKGLETSETVSSGDGSPLPLA
jgi:hypothetical protein